jgi:hypothetical protein
MGEPLQEVHGLARSATPSEPSRSRPPRRPVAVVLPATIGRADVPAVVADCLDPARGAGPLDCDGSALVDPRLAAVDAIARVALGARRGGRPFRLEHASPALLDLLALCGLERVLRARGSG